MKFVYHPMLYLKNDYILLGLKTSML